MRKVQAEPYRDIDFSKGKRGAVIPHGSGKAKISIRLDNTVLAYFRGLVEAAGGGNYQSLINDALVAHIHQRSLLAALRKVVREELANAAGSREYEQAMRRFLAKAPVKLTRGSKARPARDELHMRTRLR
jgi:uncharacterized protein (DUF4415 family)